MLLTIGCSSTDKKTRPSPLTSNSIQVGDKIISIEYSSPAVRKRKIWGELIQYDTAWRAGANGATKLVLSTGVKVNGENLRGGSYSLQI